MLIAIIILSVTTVIGLGIIIAESVQNGNLETENQKLKTQNQELENNLEKMTTENTRLEKSIADANANRDAIFTQLNDERKGRERLKAELRHLTMINGAFDDVNQKVADAKTELELAKAEQASVDSTLHQTERKIEDAEEKLHGLEVAIEEKQKNLSELETRLMSRSQLERSDEDTAKLQAEIEAIEAQISACEQTSELAEKISYTVSPYPSNSSNKRLCNTHSSFISCIIVGFSADGNIAFAYPVVRYVQMRDFENNCKGYRNGEKCNEAYGIFLYDADGQDEQKRLEADISAYQNLARIVVLTNDTSEIGATGKTITFKSKNIHIACGCEVSVIRHMDSNESGDHSWSNICGWKKKIAVDTVSSELRTRLNEKQSKLEQSIATNSQLFTADALLSQQ